MNCRILSTLFVRSNGEICCEDNIGARISLGRVYLSEKWSINDVFNNDKYWHIRKSLAKMVPPWKYICINCALFNSGEQLVDNLKNRQIKVIHIETSLNCNLLCPVCPRLFLKIEAKMHKLVIDSIQIGMKESGRFSKKRERPNEKTFKLFQAHS